jgi:hypothetical protein
MDDQEWRDASTEEKLDWLRDTVNRLAEHIDGPIRKNFRELAARVEALSRPKTVTLEDPNSQ